MFNLNLSVLKNNKYVKYGTISTITMISVMGISYLCYSKVKEDVLKKIKNFTNKKEIEDNSKDNKENN